MIAKYEYKVVEFQVKGWLGGKLDAGDMETRLNQYGAEGWELMELVPLLKEMGFTSALIATLKRPVQ